MSAGTEAAVHGPREAARLAAVRALRFDGPVAASVREAVRLAAVVCAVPAAVVNIVDDDTVHPVAPTTATGEALTAPPPISREDSLCRHVVADGEEVVATDASLDPRLSGSPYVDGRLASFRFYASVPLRTADGQVVGGLCAFDEQPHPVTEGQLELLRALAHHVVGVYELRAAATEATEAAQQLVAASGWAAEVLATTRDAYWAIDPDGTVTGWNPAAEELFGWTGDEAVGRDLVDLVVPARFGREFLTDLGADGLDRLVGVLRRRDGSELTADVTVWRSAARPGWHAFVRDVTEVEAARRERRQAEALLTMAFDHAPHGTAILGVRGADRGVLLRVNPALARMVYCDDLAGAHLADLVGDGPAEGGDHGGAGGDDELLAAFDELADGRVDTVQRVGRLRVGGGHLYTEATITLARDLDGRPEHALAQLRDVTQQRAYEDWLRRQAKEDGLTGLANRMAMRERLEVEIEALRHGRGALALMMLDLDHFKGVNDTLGHVAGDELLLRVAQALVDVVPPGALPVRLGGDEFVVLVAPITAPDADDLARRVVEAVGAAAAEVSAALPRPVTCSLGLVTTENPATAPEDLVRAADRAMYRAKHHRTP